MLRNYKGNSVFSVYSIETRRRISDVKTLQNSLHMCNRMFTFFKSSSCAIDLKFPTMLLEGLIYFPDIFLSTRNAHTGSEPSSSKSAVIDPPLQGLSLSIGSGVRPLMNALCTSYCVLHTIFIGTQFVLSRREYE